MYNKLKIEQLEGKLAVLRPITSIAVPPTGWIKAIRLALGMSMRQLANRLGITKQSVLEMERREQNGAITLKSLRDVADALDMDMVYGLVPRDGSLEALIDRKAHELARSIVSRSSQSMLLEDQAISAERFAQAIEDRAAQLKNEMSKILWD